jgi:hypothetical protein
MLRRCQVGKAVGNIRFGSNRSFEGLSEGALCPPRAFPTTRYETTAIFLSFSVGRKAEAMFLRRVRFGMHPGGPD